MWVSSGVCARSSLWHFLTLNKTVKLLQRPKLLCSFGLLFEDLPFGDQELVADTECHGTHSLPGLESQLPSIVSTTEGYDKVCLAHQRNQKI